MSKRRKTIINIISLLIIAILIIGLLFSSEKLINYRAYFRCQKLKDLEIENVLDSTYLSLKGTYVILLKDIDLKLITLYIHEKPSIYFNQGDSIYKPRGSFKYYIYKNKGLNDSSLIILENEFDCNNLSVVQ